MKRALVLCLVVFLAGLIPLSPIQAQSDSPHCPGALPSRLIAGEAARVLPGTANNRRVASSQASAVLGVIPGGAIFTVIDGPVCNEGYAWWQVEYQGQIGWTAEADAETYWAAPLVTITPDNAADVIQMAGLGRDGDFIGFSPDQRTLAMTSPTGVQLLDAADFSAPAREIDPLRQIDQAVFSPDWRLLATEGKALLTDRDYSRWESQWEPGVRLFDVATGHLLHEFEGPGTLAFSPDGSLLYSYRPYRDDPWTGHVWDTTTYAELSAPEGYSHVLGMVWNNIFLVVDEIGMVWQWDPRRGAMAGDEPLFGPLGQVQRGRASINPAGTLLLVQASLPPQSCCSSALWDLTTGTQRYALEQYPLALDWDSGLMVLSAGNDMRVVEIATGREVVTLPMSVEYPQAHGDPRIMSPYLGSVEQMAVSPDRSLIAVAGVSEFCSGSVGVWELGTGRFRFNGASYCYGPILFHPLTGELMYTQAGGDIQLWNPAQNLPFDLRASYWWQEMRADIRSILGSVRVYAQVAFGANGDLLVAEDTLGIVHVWDTTTWRDLSDVPQLTWDSRFALAPSSSVLVYQGSEMSKNAPERDGTLRLWDLHAGQEVGRLAVGKGRLEGLAISPVRTASGGLLVAATVYIQEPDFFNDFLYLWDSGVSVRPVAALPVSVLEQPIYALTFTPDGTGLVVGRRIVDVSAVLGLGKLPLESYRRQDEATLAWVTRVPLATKANYLPATRAVFSPDGTRLITLGRYYETATATLWDATTGAPLQSLKFPGTEEASGAAYSPDGRLLAVVTAEGQDYISQGQLYLFDTATGDLLAAPEGHRGAAWDVAFSPDGRLIASAGGGCIRCESYGGDDAIRLWQVDPDAVAGR